MKRYKRRKGRTKQVIILLLSMELLLIVGGLAYFQLRPVVAEAVTVEAGDHEVNVEEFMLSEKKEGSFLTDIKTLNTNIPGIYEIKIQVEGRVHTSLLEVVDTIAPTATVADQLALRGEEVDPKVFVVEMTDATQINVTFKEIPDTSKPGEQDVTIILEDSGKNRIEKSAKLTVLDLKSKVTIEAGSVMNITVTDFMNSDNYEAYFLTDIKALDLSKPTTHQIELSVNNKTVTGYIEVTDTTAPKATVNNQPVWLGEEVEPRTFLEDIDDVSDVVVTYKTAPDFNKLGEQEIILVLKDSTGNTTELPATMTVAEDKQAPEFLGVSDKLVYIGDSVSYKKGVTVTDNKDKELSFSVESSKVNLKKEGTYTVTYTAKDNAGNKASKKINVEVKKFVVSEDMVNKLCDDTLKKITKSNMTNREVAYAIYKWTKNHISYSGDSDKSDWLAEAYRGMTNGNGDCFTYFAVAQAMLTRAGIDNMEVNRVGGKTRHYWNLINCGDGWYHFDSCPNKDHMESFMLTDKQVEAYTKKRGNNYYNFDKTLYPATPDK
ncbi:MAG: cysteine protease [Herbinix sp.]|nr:cysteine protease [Herbinix sp.]